MARGERPGRDGSQQRPVRGLIGVCHALDVSTSSSPPSGPVTLAWAPESPGHVMPRIASGDRRKAVSSPTISLRRTHGCIRSTDDA